MSEQITITVSNEIYQQIVKQAAQKQKKVSDIVYDVVAETFPHQTSASNPSRDKMMREVEAYKKLHPQLVKQYLGKFVAIHQGEVVDHDADKEALFFRIKKNFPNQVVLQRQVLPDPDPVLHFRSPRLLQK